MNNDDKEFWGAVVGCFAMALVFALVILAVAVVGGIVWLIIRA